MKNIDTTDINPGQETSKPFENFDFDRLKEQIVQRQREGRRGTIDIGNGGIAVEFRADQDPQELIERIRGYATNNIFDRETITVI